MSSWALAQLGVLIDSLELSLVTTAPDVDLSQKPRGNPGVWLSRMGMFG